MKTGTHYTLYLVPGTRYNSQLKQSENKMYQYSTFKQRPICSVKLDVLEEEKSGEGASLNQFSYKIEKKATASDLNIQKKPKNKSSSLKNTRA